MRKRFVDPGNVVPKDGAVFVMRLEVAEEVLDMRLNARAIMSLRSSSIATEW